MHISQFHYLPLAPGFFSILVALFIGMVLIFALLGALRHAYLSLGVTPRTAMLLLVGSLVGSYFNIPIAALPPEQVQSDKVIEFFGMHYNVPVVENLSGTVIAINVGGAVIPDDHVALPVGQPRVVGPRRHRYRYRRHRAALARQPGSSGVGIAVPVFIPAVVTAVVSLLLSRINTAPLAYVSGSMGTLIGADLTNLDKVQGIGAPVASIGGAKSTFDGIFLTGILAVLLARALSPASDRVAPLDAVCLERMSGQVAESSSSAAAMLRIRSLVRSSSLTSSYDQT